jgi:phosphonate degradation associated HDIG domain protein
MSTAGLTPETIVDFIADIFRRRGAEAYLGEAVSMSEHMRQAAHLAEREGAEEALIAAALLHDIGHFTNEFPEDYIAQRVDNLHEEAGARVLEAFFPPQVVEPVRHHVAAKRYLCKREPSYFATLSPASVKTLELQGGPMSEAEARAFEQHPHLQAIVRVRRWDEAAKAPDRPTPPFEHYAPLLRRVAAAHAGGRDSAG